MFGCGSVGGEGLHGGGAVDPAAVEFLDRVAVAWPIAFVGVFDDDLAGTDAGDIIVPVDDGTGGHGFDSDGVVGVFGFALGDLSLKLAGLRGAGAEEQGHSAQKCPHWLGCFFSHSSYSFWSLSSFWFLYHSKPVR